METGTGAGGLAAVDVEPVPYRGLYVHVPFCASICPYCDFAVRPRAETEVAEYAELIELELGLVEASSTELESVYLGGGTPSALSGAAIARLLDAVRGRFEVRRTAELTLEVNPEDVTGAAMRSWRQAGIDRISLGVQSFDDASLRFLGRRHDGSAARSAAGEVLSAGFASVSLDLIYGLPESIGPSPARTGRDLEIALELSPDHLSCYELTVHDGTPFGRWQARGSMPELADAARAVEFERVHESLESGGYEAYEVSNFARPGGRSRHNQKYWQRQPVLGVGPSAHSFDGRRRWWNHRSFEDWRGALQEGRRPIAEIETLSVEQEALELLALGLRTRDGVGADLIEALAVDAGAGLSGRRELEAWEERGWAERSGERLRLSRAGLLQTDALVARLVQALLG